MSNNPREGQPPSYNPNVQYYKPSNYHPTNPSTYLSPNNSMQPNQNNDMLGQPTYKERNRAMYASSMEFTSSNSNNMMGGLDSFGKSVAE